MWASIGSARPCAVDQDRCSFGLQATAVHVLLSHHVMGTFEREIEAVVRRWVAPPLIVACSGCQVASEELHTPAAGSGGSTASSTWPDSLASFAPALPARGSGFEPAHCTNGRWDPLPHVNPEIAHDYLSLWQVDRISQTYSLISEAGIRCATASDKGACESAVVTRPESCDFGCPPYYISTTLGDKVDQYISVDLPYLLGVIDFSEEALLLTRFAGYEPGHGDDPCTSATVRASSDGYFDVYARRRMWHCAHGSQINRVALRVSPSGDLGVEHSVLGPPSSCGAVPGRRPDGLRIGSVQASDVLGQFFATCAQLEAAAVHAFSRMQAELLLHQAPQPLVLRALTAQYDERRHARAMAALAARFGGSPTPIEVAAPRARPLLEMAIENAAEGCARETWSAVVATHQAACASTPAVRYVMRAIAADERRHASLSFCAASWLDTRLSTLERRLVRDAYREAMAGLASEVTHDVSEELVRDAGLPPRRVASALLRSLDASLRTRQL